MHSFFINNKQTLSLCNIKVYKFELFQNKKNICFIASDKNFYFSCMLYKSKFYNSKPSQKSQLQLSIHKNSKNLNNFLLPTQN